MVGGAGHLDHCTGAHPHSAGRHLWTIRTGKRRLRKDKPVTGITCRSGVFLRGFAGDTIGVLPDDLASHTDMGAL